MRFIQYNPTNSRPISTCIKFVVCLLLLRRTITEHVGERSVGVEMEAYGDPVAAASNHFCYMSEEPSKKPLDPNIEHLVQLARSDRGHLNFSNCTDSVQ